MVRINLILNEPWTPELTNENSEPYNKLASTWRGEITQIFANFPGQKVVTILKFSEAVSSSKTLVTMDLSLNDGDDSKDDLEKMKYLIVEYQGTKINVNVEMLPAFDGKLIRT